MFLLTADADGSPRLLVFPAEPEITLADRMAMPDGAAPAICEGCRQTIYRRPDGVWTLGRPPWFCYPDPDLAGVLAQLHTPKLRRWKVTVEAATRAAAEQLARGVSSPGRQQEA
jgi:hypothetical protein